MYYCGYMVLFSNVETGIGLFASSMPAIRRLYFLIFKPEQTQESSQPQVNIMNEGIVTIGGTGGTKEAKLKARTAVMSVFSTNNDRGPTQSRADSRCGDWERLADDGSDNGSKKVGADCTYTVEMHPVKPGESQV